jgi:hypothetical protein
MASKMVSSLKKRKDSFGNNSVAINIQIFDESPSSPNSTQSVQILKAWTTLPAWTVYRWGKPSCRKTPSAGYLLFLMKNNTYNALRLFAGLLTIVIVIAHQYIPNKQITVLPNSNYPQSIYSPQSNSETLIVAWIDENQHHIRCTFSEDHDFSCGYSLSLSTDNKHGLNLEEYNVLNIKVNYTGTAHPHLYA